MNTPNACVFFGVGMMMELLHLVPDITGVRELWLITMGVVMMLTGGLFLAHETWVWLKPRMITPMLAWVPQQAQASQAQGRAVPQGRRATV